MTVVIDVGCEPQKDERSIEPLLARFRPWVLYGFDPLLETEGWTEQEGTMIYRQRMAAWTDDDPNLQLAVGAGGIDATPMRAKNGRREWARVKLVRAFNLSQWISDLRTDDEVVLKIDAEGSEFPILERMHLDGTDERVSLALVEFHSPKMGAHYQAWEERLRATLRCRIGEWV